MNKSSVNKQKVTLAQELSARSDLFIQPLILKPMSGIQGIRERIKKNYKNILGATLLSTVVGGGTGLLAVHGFHSSFPEQQQKSSIPLTPKLPETFAQPSKSANPPANGTSNINFPPINFSITQQTEEEMLDEQLESIPELKKYKDALDQLLIAQRNFNQTRQQMLDLGEQLSFYLSFLLAFSATMKIFFKIKHWLNPIDPILEDNLRKLVLTVNQLNQKHQHTPADLREIKATTENIRKILIYLQDPPNFNAN